MQENNVFAVLNALNCNEHTERKGNLTYLSWAWAWQMVKSHYPRCCRWKNNNASGSKIG